jgi:hypothetical protein
VIESDHQELLYPFQCVGRYCPLEYIKDHLFINRHALVETLPSTQ